MGAFDVMNRSLHPSASSPSGAADDWLDALLASDAADHRAGYIADEGFTARVIRKLPAVHALPAWRRPAVGAIWLVAGLLLAMMLPGTAHEVAREAVALFVARPFSLSSLALTLLALGVATWTGAALALRRD